MATQEVAMDVDDLARVKEELDVELSPTLVQPRKKDEQAPVKMGKRKPVYRKQSKKILIKCARQIKLQRLPDLSNGTIRRPQLENLKHEYDSDDNTAASDDGLLTRESGSMKTRSEKMAWYTQSREAVPDDFLTKLERDDDVFEDDSSADSEGDNALPSDNEGYEVELIPFKEHDVYEDVEESQYAHLTRSHSPPELSGRQREPNHQADFSSYAGQQNCDELGTAKNSEGLGNCVHRTLDFHAPNENIRVGMNVELDDQTPSNSRTRASVARDRDSGACVRQAGPSKGHCRPKRKTEIEWTVGDVLNEVYAREVDIPADLSDKVKANEKKRKERASKAKAKLGKRSGRESESDDEFREALDGTVIDSDFDFRWSSMHEENFESREENFVPERTGSVHEHTTPYSAFRFYWNEEIMERIANETNRYATCHPKASSGWHPTNTHELLLLFAFWMMLGVIKMPTLKSCFTTRAIMQVPILKKLMKKRRYEALVKYLHFVDTSQSSNDASSDRLFKLRPILDHLNKKFQEAYVPRKDITIDESHTLWNGRLAIRQYIRTEAAKFAIEIFELCESGTGYLWSFIVYASKQQERIDNRCMDLLPKCTSIAIKLVKPLLHKGYRLFMDDRLNSPILARFLKRNGTDCVGALKASRIYVPSIVSLAPLKRGEFVARHSGDVCLISWQDKIRVITVSTCHGSAVALPAVLSRKTIRPLPYKPQAVLDYERSMSGVGLKDETLEPYLLERKRCPKWYLKLFKLLLNISILNARILVESSTGKRQQHCDFRISLVESIIEQHLPFVVPHRPSRGRRTSGLDPDRLIPTHHWPVPVEQRACSSRTNRKTTVRCVVCTRFGRKNIKTPYKCETCNVPLCIDPCFKSFHQHS